MESSKIKSFPCEIHPSESIQRICTDADTKSCLRCIECLVSSSVKKSVLKIDDFLSQVIKHSQSDITSLGDSAPNHLVEFLSNEEESIEKLAEVLEKEKKKVIEVFEKYIEETTTVFRKSRDETLQKLDDQISNLKRNYSYYREKLNKYYGQQEDQPFLEKSTLIQKINQCNDTKEMECLIKDLQNSITQNFSSLRRQQKIDERNEGIRKLALELQHQSQIFPAFPGDTAESIPRYRDYVKLSLTRQWQLQNPVFELSFTPGINSNIVKSSENLKLLTNWISSSGGLVSLKLLYRGSEHEFMSEKFHELCDGYQETLTIIKTNHGKICGGFSDKSWTGANFQRFSDKAWLFSLNEKKKYPIKKSCQANAITGGGAGPSFGRDLTIQLKFPTKSNFPSFKPQIQSRANIGSDYGEEDEEQSQNQQQQQTPPFGKFGGGFGNGFGGGPGGPGILNRTILPSLGSQPQPQPSPFSFPNSFRPSNFQQRTEDNNKFAGAMGFDLEEIEVYYVISGDL